MKLLKELFSFDEQDDDEFAPREEDEFNFDFDFENPDMDQELDFNQDEFAGPEMDVEDESGYGAEEDYPEGMIDMPHDEYAEDGEGGLEDGVPDEREELDDIKGEIESLYARLGKLAAAGDLNLLDDTEGMDDMEMDGNPEFASFQDVDMGYEDESMEPDFGGGEDVTPMEPEMDDLGSMDDMGDPSRGNPMPTNRGAPPLEDEMNSRFSPRRRSQR